MEASWRKQAYGTSPKRGCSKTEEPRQRRRQLSKIIHGHHEDNLLCSWLSEDQEGKVKEEQEMRRRSREEEIQRQRRVVKEENGQGRRSVSVRVLISVIVWRRNWLKDGDVVRVSVEDMERESVL